MTMRLVPLSPQRAPSPSENDRHLIALCTRAERALAADRHLSEKLFALEHQCEDAAPTGSMNRARTAADRATGRSRAAIAAVSAMRALTPEGLIRKATLLATWQGAGYGLSDQGEDLVNAIARDATQLLSPCRPRAVA